MQYIVEEIIWGYPLMILLLIVCVYFSIKTRFVQFRFLKLIPKFLFVKSENKEKVSPYQTFSLILANHVGTGNIIGVAVAIMYGGPGAVFWMWITALLGSILSFVENTLGQMYKIEKNGEYRGGAAYYILHGIGSKTWANIIALIFFICLGIFMPTIQAATISTTINNTFGFSKVVVGLFTALTIGLVISGKSKRIVNVAEVVVPFMSISYLLVTLIIIVLNITKIDNVLILIINNAFNKKAIFGSVIGSAISFGVRRGFFSHEAGIGSAPNISASSDVDHPVKQGLLSSVCVFIDTIVICSATAFIILITNCFNVVKGEMVLFEGLKGKDYSQFASEAINTVFANFGLFFITIALFLFAFASLFSGFFNAQTNLLFLFKSDSKYKCANNIYKIIFLLIIFLCSIFNTKFAWGLTDIGVGLATLVNIVVLILLKEKVVEVLDDFELKYKKKDKSRYYNKELMCWKD